MADIELVIKIPEESYKKWSCSHPANNTYPEWYIMHGIPLPKGHGRLIAADDLKNDILRHEYSNSFCEEHHIDHSINTEIALAIIDNAPTILEADKE